MNRLVVFWVPCISSKDKQLSQVSKKIASRGNESLWKLLLLVLPLSFAFPKPVWNPNSSSPFCYSWNQVRKPRSEAKLWDFPDGQGQRHRSTAQGRRPRFDPTFCKLRVCTTSQDPACRPRTERSRMPQTEPAQPGVHKLKRWEKEAQHLGAQLAGSFPGRMGGGYQPCAPQGRSLCLQRWPQGASLQPRAGGIPWGLGKEAIITFPCRKRSLQVPLQPPQREGPSRPQVFSSDRNNAPNADFLPTQFTANP